MQLLVDNKYYDLKLVSLIWENEVATMFVLNDITDKIISMKQIEEISHYKDLLLATVTHDLKTPLIAIISYEKMLAKEIKHGSYNHAEEYISIIENNSILLQNLIMDI